MNKIAMPVMFVALLFASANAQYATSASYDYNLWQNELSLMSWIPGQSGIITIQGQDYDADLVFKELIRKVNWSLNLRYEGRLDLWMVNWTGAFTKSYDLSDERDVETSLTLTDFTIGFMPWWERFYILAGGRYFNASTKVVNKFEDSIEENKGSKDWFDLFVGARYEIPLGDRFAIRLRGDVGALGSDFSWNTAAFLRWSISNFALEAGYRTWGVDYQEGSGENLFRYDVVTTGPGFGFAFHF